MLERDKRCERKGIESQTQDACVVKGVYEESKEWKVFLYRKPKEWVKEKRDCSSLGQTWDKSSKRSCMLELHAALGLAGPPCPNVR